MPGSFLLVLSRTICEGCLLSQPTCQMRYDSFPTWRSVWDMATGKEMSMLEGHSSAVSSVAISLDGKTIVSGSYDKTIRYGREAALKMPGSCIEATWKMPGSFVLLLSCTIFEGGRLSPPPPVKCALTHFPHGAACGTWRPARR